MFCLVSTASAAQKVQIELKSRNNLKVTEFHRILIEGRKVIVDSMLVDPLAVPAFVKPLRQLAQVEKVKDGRCAAGTYTHTVKRGRKVLSTTGCLNTDRAAILFGAMDVVVEMAEYYSAPTL